MEQMKTPDTVWSGILFYLAVALIASVILAVVGWAFVKWAEFAVCGQMNVFFKTVLMLFPPIGIGIVIVYLLDRNDLI